MKFETFYTFQNNFTEIMDRENPTLAYFHGLPKIHKPNTPLRPVISNVGTITRPLAGWLAKSLTNHLGSFSTSHIKNSLDFKEKIQDFARNNDISALRMVSFDVESLFTNVPTDVVIDFIEYIYHRTKVN